ncbi:MAG: class I SAM-dependent methyltransferase [Candidatus Dormiibacterota bacterium]
MLALLAAAQRTAAGHRRQGALLALLAAIGFGRRYRHNRHLGQLMTEEHVRRMRRLRWDALEHFYMTCISSMEDELELFPPYDRHKHEQRYALLADLAIEHTPVGGTVVDVGCASAIVLDQVHQARDSVGIGLDLTTYGLKQRARRANPPVLAQALAEQVPLPDEVADTVIFSEVIEHLVDAWAGMTEASRITRPGGTVILTTNNGSEMPEVSPLVDPLTWGERLLGRWRPGVLSFRNITWHEPINDPDDPLPRDAPTYVPHVHFAFAELRDLAQDAGFDVVAAGSFEYPAPQSVAAAWLRRVVDASPRLGYALADTLEATIAATPGLNLMGTHHLIVLRKVRRSAAQARKPWWPAQLPQDLDGKTGRTTGKGKAVAGPRPHK